jgi:hypothetical protein
MAAGTYNPPASASPVIDVDWNIGGTPGGGCDNEFISVRLIVTGTDSSTDTITLGTWKIDQKAPSRAGRRASLNSSLRVPPFDGTVQGRVLLNGSTVDATDSSGPFQHQFMGQPGMNTVEAYTTVSFAGDGFWRFDLTSTEGVVDGSLRVEHGQVLSFGERSIVFRLSGTSGERVRFTYRLLP